MRKVSVLVLALLLLTSLSIVSAQDYVRKKVDVPRAKGTIKIDGKMDDADWANAAHADMITNKGYEIWTNNYGRESLKAPDYDAMYGRMLWSEDTLYVFMHIDEFVNDSTNLFWKGKWTGDQLFISLSDRLGIDMKGWYDGNIYAAPDGPYHLLILGDKVTLNNGDTTKVPEEYRPRPQDSLMIHPDAAKYVRWATVIDTVKGIWDVELAIYNPGVSEQGQIGFNIGGSTGSRQADAAIHDAYAYYTWQPNKPNDPYTDPTTDAKDPGYYNLASSKDWALLNFLPGTQDSVTRKTVTVPKATGTIKIDGKMDDADWTNAAHADMITNKGYEIWTNNYGRESLKAPDYDAMYGRMLWSQDTLYVFMHIDEFVNDSTNLFWKGKWTGDQLFISLSDRLGLDMKGWYDGNIYAAPDGPYHFLVLGDKVTLNNGDTTNIPEEYRKFPGDTVMIHPDAAKYARWATVIDTVKGVWDVEMAIYNPGIAAQGQIGFNIGGSTGSRQADAAIHDAYAYYTWQPNKPNDPYTDPTTDAKDPGFYNLANSKHWAVLQFSPSGVLGVETDNSFKGVPSKYALEQNFPNPFNPSTSIRFDVPQEGLVTLKVYNIVGQVVATLVNNQSLSAGRHIVSFDASRLSSGVYFYSMEANGMVITKKMMLLK
ncbi:MAG: T9SS type A sorting domain-containing protein [Acidobacteriota bacterium]